MLTIYTTTVIFEITTAHKLNQVCHLNFFTSNTNAVLYTIELYRAKLERERERVLTNN
jgi:hypothetical protein